MSADSPLQGIRAFLKDLSSSAKNAEGNPSCFLVNSILEVARHNSRVQKRVNLDLDAVQTLLRQALDVARDSGELGLDKDQETLAAFIMTNIWGLRVLMAAGADSKRVQTVVDQLLGLLE